METSFAETAFTPLSALAGGALIGLAAVLLMALNGRIAGISGVAGALVSGGARAGERSWRLAFVAGLLAGPLLYALLAGGPPAIELAASPLLLAVAGVLVGAGTMIGSGCTSGHGVCGIARLSPRSLAATLIFMGVAAGVVFAVRHAL